LIHRRRDIPQVTTSAPPRRGLYYGWYVVAASVFIVAVTAGARNSFGVFVVPMEEEFGWSRFTISLAAGVGVLVSGLAQPFMGRIFDRTGGRTLILGCVVVIGLSTLLLSLTFHILFLIFMFGIVASVAGGGASLTNTGALVAKWFRRRRATVLGLNATGLSLGGLVMVPFAWYVLEATSWRVSWAALGVVVLIALPLGWFFIHEHPGKKGLQPDGDTAPSGEDLGATQQRSRGPLEVDKWSESFRSLPIWQMSGSYLVCGSTTFVLSVHFVPYAIDRGVSPGTGAMIFGLMMGLNIVGSVGAGMLADRVGGTKNWLALVYLVRGLGYMLLIVPPMLGVPVLSGTLGLWLFACVAGFSWVATAPLTTALTADIYGLRTLGTVSGVTLLFHQIGGFGSVLLAGLLYDLTGSYTLPFLLVGSLLFPAAFSAFNIKERKYSTRYLTQVPAVVSAGN